MQLTERKCTYWKQYKTKLQGTGTPLEVHLNFVFPFKTFVT